MPHRLRSSFVLLLLLCLGTGLGLAQGLAGPRFAPVGEVLATGGADDHDPAHDDHAHDDPAHDDPAHDDHAHDDPAHDEHAHDHGHGTAGGRLLVASLDGPELAVLDAESGAIVGRFSVPGVGRVHQLPSGQLAAVVHREAHRVSFVHSGLTVVDHGDHADLLEGPPYVLATVNLGRGPATLFAAGHDIAVSLADEDGVAWLDARLLGVSLDYVALTGAGVAAGAGALAVLDGHLIVAEADGAAVRVYDRRATPIADFGGCPDPRGQAVLGDTAAFGCGDGVLLVRAVGGVFVAHKLTRPADAPQGARVATLAAPADGGATLAGDLGRGVVLIDPVARTLTPVDLPDAPVGLAFTDGGERLLVLTRDGQLHALDAATGAVEASLHAMHGMAAPDRTPASMVVIGDALFVADPEARELVWVDLDHLEVEARWPLPFAPSSLAAMAIEGAVRH